MANINEMRRKSMNVITLGSNLNMNVNVNKNFKPSKHIVDEKRKKFR